MTRARTDGNRVGGDGVRFTDADYRAILHFRTRLRRFLAWSGAQARAAGITPAQHQLLLAVRGHDDPDGPTISDVAAYLQLRHHSAVGLVDRAEAVGLVRRAIDQHDRRLARVQLCEPGARVLAQLTALHVTELRALAGGTLPAPPTDGCARADQSVDEGVDKSAGSDAGQHGG